MSDENKTENKTGRVVEIISDKLVVDASEVVETASITPEEVLGEETTVEQTADIGSETQEKKSGLGRGTRKTTTGASCRPELL
jgi:acyl-[acyl carrier protein]--UDP-N-acetylglucosamine O-acyltransferase